MRRFLEILDTKGKARIYTIWLIGACLLYAICYQLVSYVMYRLDNLLLLYVCTYGLSLLAGGILAYMTLKIQKSQEEVLGNSWQKSLVSFVLIQTILYLIMSVLGYASFAFALSQHQGLLAYLVNALLVLAVLFYIPVQLFSFQKLRRYENPFRILYNSVKTILHQYQPVFYSCLILAIIFIGYRYLMQSLFQFQMNVALYDLPMELLTRYVPFLETINLITLLPQNQALLLPFFFSIFFAIVQCGTLLLFLYYLGCIRRKEEQALKKLDMLQESFIK